MFYKTETVNFRACRPQNPSYLIVCAFGDALRAHSFIHTISTLRTLVKCAIWLFKFLKRQSTGIQYVRMYKEGKQFKHKLLIVLQFCSDHVSRACSALGSQWKSRNLCLITTVFFTGSLKSLTLTSILRHIEAKGKIFCF